MYDENGNRVILDNQIPLGYTENKASIPPFKDGDRLIFNGAVAQEAYYAYYASNNQTALDSLFNKTGKPIILYKVK